MSELEADPRLTVYGAPWCGDCKRAKKFLGEQRVPYRWVDIEEDPAAEELVKRLNHGRPKIPTIVFDDGSLLAEPSNAELAARLGLPTRARMDFYDLIIVGGGPAGLTAALYAAREGLEVLVIERAGLGGQAGITERLDNFPGFPEGIGGGEFADRLVAQVKRFDAELLQAQSVTGLRADDASKGRFVTTEDGTEYGAQAILIATGSTYRRLGVPGEEDLIGAGIHYCATCDGPFYKGRPVAVIGGGNSAGEESLFLTRFASEVTLLVRGPEMSASRIVVDKVTRDPKIAVRTNTELTALHGEDHLRGLTVRDRRTGATEELTPAGLFVFIGVSPNSGWLPDAVVRDDHGFIVTGPDLSTSLSGVFAAGDVRLGSTKQAASAAGEGAAAALMIREYLKET